MDTLQFSGSGWKNGKSAEEANQYGIASREFRNYLEHHFGKVQRVYVSFVDEPKYSCMVELTNGFWNKCPELKHKKIKQFLADKDLLAWEKNNPPSFSVSPSGANCEVRLLVEDA